MILLFLWLRYLSIKKECLFLVGFVNNNDKMPAKLKCMRENIHIDDYDYCYDSVFCMYGSNVCFTACGIYVNFIVNVYVNVRA